MDESDVEGSEVEACEVEDCGKRKGAWIPRDVQMVTNRCGGFGELPVGELLEVRLDDSAVWLNAYPRYILSRLGSAKATPAARRRVRRWIGRGMGILLLLKEIGLDHGMDEGSQSTTLRLDVLYECGNLITIGESNFGTTGVYNQFFGKCANDLRRVFKEYLF